MAPLLSVVVPKRIRDVRLRCAIGSGLRRYSSPYCSGCEFMRTADSENGGPCFFLNIGAAVKAQVEFGLAVEEFAIAHSVPKFPRGQEKQMMEDNSEFGLFGRAIRTSQSRTKFVLASMLGLALLIPCG